MSAFPVVLHSYISLVRLIRVEEVLLVVDLGRTTLVVCSNDPRGENISGDRAEPPSSRPPRPIDRRFPVISFP